MNIYYIERTDYDGGYDEFDSWVVFAKDKAQALCISPHEWKRNHVSPYRDVTCTLLGTSFEETEASLIISSFNAG